MPSLTCGGNTSRLSAKARLSQQRRRRWQMARTQVALGMPGTESVARGPMRQWSGPGGGMKSTDRSDLATLGVLGRISSGAAWGLITLTEALSAQGSYLSK